jgi:hypothetical protein
MHTTEPRTDRPSRLRRALTLAAGAVAVAFVLSGCVKLDMALTVTPENTIDGTIVFAVDKQLLTLGGGNPEDAFKDAAGDAPFPTAPAGGSVTTEVYDQDGKYGQKFTFTGVPLSEFDDEDLSITREGDFFVVAGTLDLSDTGASSGSSEEPLPLPSSLTAGFDVSVSMTFPGEVVEHNGTLSGTTVTWVPKPGEKLVMSAKAKATGGSAGVLGLSSASSSTPLIIGLVLAALLLVGGLVALLLRRGRTPAAAGAVGAAMPDASAVPGFAPAPSTPADPSWAPPAMPGAAAPAPPVPPAPAPPAPGGADPSQWAPPPAMPETPAPPVHDTLVVPEEAPTAAVAPEPSVDRTPEQQPPPPPAGGSTDGQAPPA